MRTPLIRLTFVCGVDKLCGRLKDLSLNMLQRYFKNPIRRIFAVAVAGCLTLAAFGSQRPSSVAAKSPQRAMIDRYCTNCHNADD